MKILVYVDADNVSADEIKFSMETIIIGKMDPNDIIVGKFYGDLNKCKKQAMACYEYGLDPVDIGTLVFGKKNTADMKLVVDCLTDVLQLHVNEVRDVVILSKDCDFIPLERKLKANQINVSMPLYDVTNRTFTEGDLVSKLRSLNFDPVNDGYVALCNPYTLVKNQPVGDFSDDLLKTYSHKRQMRILSALRLVIEPEATKALAEVPTEKFSFKNIADKCPDEKLGDAANVYVSKTWGHEFKASEARYYANCFLKEYEKHRVAVQKRNEERLKAQRPMGA